MSVLVCRATRSEVMGSARSRSFDRDSGRLSPAPEKFACRPESILSEPPPMTFSWPWALLSLLIIPIVAGVVWLLRRRRRRAAVQVTSIALVRAALPPRTRWTRLIPTLLLLLGFATLSVGAARPQATVPVPSNSTTIMLAMDVSGSMCSTDVEPNRLTVAQKAAVSFIESLDGETKIGLVAFAGVAGLQVPPTTDKDALIEAINNFTTARGTAIGSAILTSIDGIAAINPTVAPTGVDAESAQRSGYAADVIVVLTDGANTQGVEPATAAESAAVRGLKGVHDRIRHDHPLADGLHRPAGRRMGRPAVRAAVSVGAGAAIRGSSTRPP